MSVVLVMRPSHIIQIYVTIIYNFYKNTVQIIHRITKVHDTDFFCNKYMKQWKQ